MKIPRKQSMYTYLKSILYPNILSSRTIFVVISILISALLIDSATVKIYTFLNSIADPEQQNLIFIFLALTLIIAQYFILAVAQNRIKESKSVIPLFAIIQKIITVSQYTISILLLIIISEILLNASFDTFIMILIIIISYGVSCVSLGLLALRFFIWFRSRKSYSVLLYGLASAIFVFSNLFVMTFASYIIPQMGSLIESHGHVMLYSNHVGSFEFILYNGYVISSIISFIVMWIATAMILKYYSRRIGNIKYWLFVSLPLIYFLSQFISLFLNLFRPMIEQNPFFYGVLLSVIFSVSKSTGGMLFGLAFWIMARKTGKNTALRDFLMIAAIGFMLLFVSEQAVSLISAPYPPFGLTSVATVGLSSYIILIGLHYSAISVSNDTKIRNYIRSKAINELTLLRTIQSAQTEEVIEKTVIRLLKKHSAEIESEAVDISPENIKEYTLEVLEEMKSSRKLKTDG
jgi:hypothetical protein